MTVDDTQDREGLLSSDVADYDIPIAQDRHTQRTLRWHTYCLGASLVLNICLAIGLSWSLMHVRIQDPQLEVFSPANSAVEYEDVVFYDGIFHFSPYQFPPNDTIDDMWSNLYSNAGTTRVDAKSARLLPNKTVVIPGTDHEGLVQIEVFHALHCINSLRKSLWPDRFPTYSIFQNGTRDDLITMHHMHCIDRLRQNVQCASNIGTSTWRWHPDAVDGPRWMLNMEMTYKCRNYDRIHQWAIQNEYLEWDDTIPSELTKGWSRR